MVEVKLEEMLVLARLQLSSVLLLNREKLFLLVRLSEIIAGLLTNILPNLLMNLPLRK